MLTNIVLCLLILLIVFFSISYIKDLIQAAKTKQYEQETNFWKMGILGFVALFLDALGIGSFNTITAASKNFNLVKDKKLPGTLIVSTTIAAALIAFVFVTTIDVDPTTLVVMTICSSLGAFIGAGIVSKMPEKWIQLVMGTALFAVAVFILLGQVNLMPVGGEAIGLTGWNLFVAGVVLPAVGRLLPSDQGPPCDAPQGLARRAGRELVDGTRHHAIGGRCVQGLLLSEDR